MTKQSEIAAITKSAAPLFGTKTDAEIAVELGVRVRTISYLRRKLQSPRTARVLVWTPEKIALLGTKSDADIAADLNCSTDSVFAARKRLGVAACRQKFVSWRQSIELDQSEFLRIMLDRAGMTRRELADSACVTPGRIDKWAAPGGGREPMPIYMRRLIFLICVYRMRGHREDD